jgi:hypothetical protein
LRVHENRVLRRILRPKREEVREDWRRLRQRGASPNIIRLINSRRM